MTVVCLPRLYYLYNHWTMQAATYFFVFVNLSLAVFEDPAVYPLPFLVTIGIKWKQYCNFVMNIVENRWEAAYDSFAAQINNQYFSAWIWWRRLLSCLLL